MVRAKFGSCAGMNKRSSTALGSSACGSGSLCSGSGVADSDMGDDISSVMILVPGFASMEGD